MPFIPHTMFCNASVHDRPSQNRWYDEECRNTRRCWQQELAIGIHKQARATFQCLVRKKTREYFVKFEGEIINCSLAKTVIEHEECFKRGKLAWHEYAKILYDIPMQVRSLTHKAYGHINSCLMISYRQQPKSD
jgi:hypothetical protein